VIRLGLRNPRKKEGNNLSSDLMKRGESRVITSQFVKSTTAIFLLRIASVSEKMFAKFSGIFFPVLVCLKSVFSDGQDVKYDRDIPTHIFSTVQTVTKRRRY